jgi:hypothetical protein
MTFCNVALGHDITRYYSHSPHQSPHVVMTPHHIVRYPLIEDKERAQQHGSPPV